MKQSQAINNTAAFFPNHFKKIGLIVALLPVALIFLAKYFFPDTPTETKLIVKDFLFNVTILGILIIAWSRDKEEDEMSMQNRLQALGFVVFTAVLMMMINPLVNLFWGEPFQEMSAKQLMLFILLGYIVFYKIRKRSA